MNILSQLDQVVGRANVVVDAHVLEPYLEERRQKFVSRAICAVLPGSTAEVASIVQICRQRRISITPQGGNTGLCGGAVADGGIVVNLKRMNKIRGVDADAYTMELEAGCILADVQSAADECDRYFPLSLGAEGSCQIGGNLSTNAGGVNVLKYGNIRDLVLGLETVLPSGEIWHGLQALRKNNTGYDLKNLFIGAEGTLGIITAATLKLFPKPHHHATSLLALKSVQDVIDLFALARTETSDFVSSFELMSRTTLESAFKHIPGCRDLFDDLYEWYVLIELGDSTAEGISPAVSQSFLEQALESGFIEDAVIAQTVQQAEEMWRLRAAVTEAQIFEGRSIKNDVSVPISCIPEFIDIASSASLEQMPGVRCFIYGHIGDGNLHFNLCQPPAMDPDIFSEKWEDLTDVINEQVSHFGGSFSAEHGIGLLKVRDMQLHKSQTELNVMRAIKSALDPDNIMNPGKILP